MECKSSTSNPSVCKLHAASVSNALEELEQRVCASVLKMYLQVICLLGSSSLFKFQVCTYLSTNG